ncbi:energy transducer TonB [Sulfurimonas sp. SAG-AH-194-L11]|nr:energy transducer TonB [Sulfurimonas sp. SAG-AH-194-L11]MDF1876448.1 energy transducer TonB [Sulfurimonas sp. SAG-AH-194-L11]
MMIRYSNSFIFSIIIHIALLIGLFFSYKQFSVGVTEQEKAPLLCIKLCNVPEEVKVVQTSRVTKVFQKKKEIKRYKKRVPVVDKVAVKDEVLVVNKDEKKSIIKEKEKVEEEVKVKKSEEVEVKKRSRAEKVLPEPVKKVENVKLVKAKVAPQKEYIDENIAKIIALLQENLYYPRRARKRGIQGEVIVRFSLSADAKVSNIEVLSSQSDVLSRGAIQTIKNIDSKLPKPKQSITFNLPISYRLN